MNTDKMYKELVDEIGILPVICNEGLEHSDSWVEIESKNGEEKVVVCSKCGREVIKDFMEKKGELYVVQDVWEDFVKKNQINT